MKNLLRSMKQALALAVITSVFAIVPAMAQSPAPSPSTGITQGPVACGIELQSGTNCSVNGQMGEDKVMGIIRQIINVASLIVGAICVIMIIFGGFRYMISGGESAGVTSAKNTILYAVVGLVVVLLSQALVRFVFARTTAGGT